MNRMLKRTLAIGVTAPALLVSSVGPAGASSLNVDQSPTVANTPFGRTITCDHPLDADLRFRVSLYDEGNQADRDDIDAVVVDARDEDYIGGPFDTNDPIDVRRIKIEFFADDADAFNDHPDRILSRTERVRRFQDGREVFRADRDDVGFVRTTVQWYGPAGFGDDDGEELSCLAALPGSQIP